MSSVLTQINSVGAFSADACCVGVPTNYGRLFDTSVGSFVACPLSGDYTFDGVQYSLPTDLTALIDALQVFYNDTTIAFVSSTCSFSSTQTVFVDNKIPVNSVVLPVLNVTKALNMALPAIGSSGAFLIYLDVTNADALNVVLSDLVPSNFEVTAVGIPFGTYTQTGNQVDVFLGNLPIGSYTIKIGVTAIAQGAWSNTVDATATDITYPSPITATYTASGNIADNTPTLAVVKGFAGTPIYIGANMFVTFQVTVSANNPTTNVVLTDVMPASLVPLVAGFVSVGTMTLSGQTVTWNLGIVPVGTYTSAVQVNPASLITNATNTATVETYTGSYLDSASHTVTYSIIQYPALAFWKNSSTRAIDGTLGTNGTANDRSDIIALNQGLFDLTPYFKRANQSVIASGIVRFRVDNYGTIEEATYNIGDTIGVDAPLTSSAGWLANVEPYFGGQIGDGVQMYLFKSLMADAGANIKARTTPSQANLNVWVEVSEDGGVTWSTNTDNDITVPQQRYFEGFGCYFPNVGGSGLFMRLQQYPNSLAGVFSVTSTLNNNNVNAYRASGNTASAVFPNTIAQHLIPNPVFPLNPTFLTTNHNRSRFIANSSKNSYVNGGATLDCVSQWSECYLPAAVYPMVNAGILDTNPLSITVSSASVMLSSTLSSTILPTTTTFSKFVKVYKNGSLTATLPHSIPSDGSVFSFTSPNLDYGEGTYDVQIGFSDPLAYDDGTTPTDMYVGKTFNIYSY